jgi:RNA polymerase sigma-70 factor (ECF subfamily)
VTGGYPPVYALLALLCFHSARFDARMDTNNSLIVLEEQDRSRWNRELINQGLQFMSQSTGGDQVTAYHLEAAIAGEHCLAPDFASTNWTRIHDYYLALEKLKPSSVIRLNLAIATGKKDGPRAALRLLHNLEQNRALDNYYLLDASMGEFYQQLGQREEALTYFRRAMELTRSAAIRQVLEKKIARL